MKRSFKFNLVFAVILTFLSSFLSLISPLLKQRAIDDGISKGNIKLLLFFVFILFLIVLIRTILNYYGSMLSFYAGKKFVYEKYSTFLKRLLNKPILFFVHHPTGYIASRLNEVEEFSDLFSPSTFLVFGSIIQLIISTCIMISMDLKLALFVLFMIPFAIIIVLFFKKRIQNATSSMYENMAVKQQKIMQILSGIKDIKLFNREKSISNDYFSEYINCVKLEGEFRQLTIKNSSLSGLLTSTSSLLVLIGCGMLILDSKMTFGQYIAFSSYAELVLSPISMLVNFSQQFLPLLTLKGRIQQFNDELEDMEIIHYKEINSPINNIKIENLDFNYDGKQPLYSGLTFSLNQGDILQIKGPNGSGKSTLLSLLLKWYKPTKGKIKYNGISIADLDSVSLLHHIAVLPQNPYIFNESIRSNIMMGQDISDSLYRDALEKTNLAGFINSLEKGDNTILSESGNDISGGQIKKIALARSLVKNSEIFILDEPFTHLDPESVHDILATINTIQQDKILIIIDHTNISDTLANKKILLK